MYHKPYALSVIRFINILFWLAFIVGMLYLADQFGYQLHNILEVF